MYIQALFGNPSNSSGTKEVKNSAAHQAPERDSSDIPSMISDGYPSIQSLRLSSPGIPEAYKTVNNLGKRSASHELLPTHLHKQIKIDDPEVEQKVLSKSHKFSMMSKNEPDDHISLVLPGKKVFEIENMAGSKKSPALVIGSLSTSSNVGHGMGKESEQEAKIQQLEAHISHLTALVKSLEEKCNTSQQQALGAQDQIADIFRHQSTVLEEPMKEIKSLQTRAGLLETTTAGLQIELDTAYLKIQAQDQVITRISGPVNDILEEASGHNDSRKGKDQNQM